MVQSTDITLSNQSGSSYRSEHNSINQALLSLNKGGSAPSYAISGTPWLDDSGTPWILKIYDGTDWIETFKINASTNEISFDLLKASDFRIPKSSSNLTISSGSITVTDSYHFIDTEGASSTDDLDTINGGSTHGQIVMLRTVSNGRDVVVKNGTGNIISPLGTDMYLNTRQGRLVILMYNSTDSNWLVIGGSILNNDGGNNTVLNGLGFGNEFMKSYREGASWTPIFGNVTVTETTNTGTYDRVGNMVKAKGFISFNTLNTSDSSPIRFSLPVAASANDPIIFTLNPNTTTGATFAATDVIIGVCPAGSGASFELYDPSGTAYTYDGGEMSASGDFDFYVSYTAA